jgi:SAM-dependent MidA family methyltransferase
METALYEPGLGYYAAGLDRIGRSGDYYTSSHLHSAFGALIGKQVLEMWEIMDKPENFSIVEMGSGAGYVCKDLLNYLEETDLFDALSYKIIELNPELVIRQKDLLSDFSGKVQWFPTIKEIGAFTGCIISNELLDAFPVHIVQMADELKEVCVTFDGRNFIEELCPLSNDSLSEYFREFSVNLKKGHRTEVNLKIRDWLFDISKRLRKGFIITVDYGYTANEYYSEDRDRGTLMCYHRHQFNENPYQKIGLQDITAHVNFTSVKKWGEELGIFTSGFCSQGAFLVSLGIEDEIKRLYETSSDYLFEIARIKKLIMPQGLGEIYKVLVQSKGFNHSLLKGFSIKNQARILD